MLSGRAGIQIEICLVLRSVVLRTVASITTVIVIVIILGAHYMAELSNDGEKRAGGCGKFSKTGSNQTEVPHSKYNTEEIQIPNNSELRDQANDNP